MSDHRVDQRAADLLPEERAAGSADPEAQAAAILADSDERTSERSGGSEGDPTGAPGTFLEHRSAGETVTPGNSTR